MKYQIFDRKLNCFTGKPYNCKKRARTRADKLDLAYGAYRYYVKELITHREV